MARSTFSGHFRGILGNKVHYKKAGRYFARTRADEVRMSQEESAVIQRIKFEETIRLSKILMYVSRVGFAGRPNGWTPSNVFVNKNMHCVSVAPESHEVTVDYEQLAVSAGPQMLPRVTVSYMDVEHSLSFSAEAEKDFYVGCEEDDVLYAVILESVGGYCKLVKLGTRSEGTDMQVTLHELWEKANLHVYVFATDAKGKVASRSVYLPLA